MDLAGDVCWFRTPMNTIDVCSINPSEIGVSNQLVMFVGL